MKSLPTELSDALRMYHKDVWSHWNRRTNGWGDRSGATHTASQCGEVSQSYMPPVHLDDDLPRGISTNTSQYRAASVCIEVSWLLPVSRWRTDSGDLEIVDVTTTMFRDSREIYLAS